MRGWIQTKQIDLNLIDRREGTKKIIGVNWSGDETFKSVSAGTEGRYLTRNVIKKYYKAFCNGGDQIERGH